MSDLDKEFESRDIGKTTFRAYFTKTLHKLIDEDEGFSGKRPHGNSGWFYDLAYGLVSAGIIEGEYNEKYEEYEFDNAEAYAALHRLIDEL